MTHCEHGYDGHCCCNCKHQVLLHCHPFNADFGKGSILEQCGFACLNPELMAENRHATFFDKAHGMCECYEPRKLQP